MGDLFCAAQPHRSVAHDQPDNTRNLHAPLSSPGLGHALKSIANAAGVTEVIVHPHAFRHTIVGQLIDAGNLMEIVSKFMGHAYVSTTATSYWVPNVLELAEKMNNPFTGQFQQRVQETSQMQVQHDLLHRNFLALGKLHHQLRALLRVSAADGVSAAEAEQRYADLVPNEEALLRAILESSSSSISGEQAMPQDQFEEDEEVLAAAEKEESERYSSDPDEPESKRTRLSDQLNAC